ncbi:hypothetical protein ACSJL2_001413 [Serratia sarumanii]|uniref:hypothetical protein n=1 Tax=Serratia sarumanii TaxID=3020826 RepID=UPI003F6C6984
MNEITVSRLGCIVLSLFPALWGLFSLLNNTADFAGTARNAVGPLLAMQDTYQNAGVDVARDRRRLGLYVGVGCHHHAGNAGRPIRGRRRGADDRAI